MEPEKQLTKSSLFPLVQAIVQELLNLYQFPIRTKGSPQFLSATAIAAGGLQSFGILLSTTKDFGIFFGSGVPTLSAGQGSLYLRSDGSSTSTRAYINTDGGTTWTAITTVA